MGFSEGGLEEMPNSLDHGCGELEAFPRTFLQDCHKNLDEIKTAEFQKGHRSGSIPACDVEGT